MRRNRFHNFLKQVSQNPFNVEEIRQNSKELFGVYPEVIDGALSCIEKKQKYTLAEVKTAIEQFQKKEVT